MFFFKNTTPTTMNAKDPNTVNKELQRRAFGSPARDPVDMRSMEAFWDKILQDDVEGRGRKANFFVDHINYDEPHDVYQNRFDINERNKIWMDKKNMKLDNQRRQKEKKELNECTFKPHFYTHDKQMSKNNQQLYQNFLQRMAQQSKSPYVSMPVDLDVLNLLPSNPTDESPLEFSRNPKYAEDHEIQKRLYSYILNTKN